MGDEAPKNVLHYAMLNEDGTYTELKPLGEIGSMALAADTDRPFYDKEFSTWSDGFSCEVEVRGDLVSELLGTTDVNDRRATLAYTKRVRHRKLPRTVIEAKRHRKGARPRHRRERITCDVRCVIPDLKFEQDGDQVRFSSE